MDAQQSMASLIWHTYDYYLYPAGTYFGMKKSMEPAACHVFV
jgi:hypothetical protein